MPTPFDRTAFEAGLQALADQYQVHVVGTATPVSPEDDKFDISAVVTPPAA
jgi:hypothetical protein